ELGERVCWCSFGVREGFRDRVVGGQKGEWVMVAGQWKGVVGKGGAIRTEEAVRGQGMKGTVMDVGVGTWD
ncbi:hypothetical protein U1Q18_002451, partial [Sarracenia purpurea var. burkii]